MHITKILKSYRHSSHQTYVQWHLSPKISWLTSLHVQLYLGVHPRGITPTRKFHPLLLSPITPTEVGVIVTKE
jgi:hypothetical protein